MYSLDERRDYRVQIATAGRIRSEFTAAQMKRYLAYQGNLTTDRDSKIFDDKMRDNLVKVAKDASLVWKVNHYLDSIGYAASIYEYKQLEQQLLRYQEGTVPYKGKNPHFMSAKRDLMNEFSKLRLKALKYDTPEDYFKVCPKADAHAGFSWLVTGMRKKGEYLETLHVTYPIEEDLARKNKSWNKMIIAGARTQASGAYDEHNNMEETGKFDKKTRLVHMIDIYQVYGETKFARPIQEAMAKMPWYAGGKADNVIDACMRDMRKYGGYWLSIDYSKYDQSIPGWLIYEAFDVIRAAFDDEDFDDELFRICVNDFIHKVFMDGKGRLIEAHKGVPSGSMFTQIIDSIVNRLMVSTYLNTLNLRWYNMIIMGDDNVIFTPERINKAQLASYLKHNFDITVNEDKGGEGDYTDNIEFLSRYWTPLGAYRNPIILISKLLYPEKHRNYKDAGPDIIIDAYIRTFPAGMMDLVSDERFRQAKTLQEIKQLGGGKLMSGLLRYQLEYEY